MKDERQARPELQIWIYLAQCRDAILRIWERDSRKFGLTVAQADLIYVVKSMNAMGITPIPADLARWLFRKPHSVFSLIKTSEKRGLITRKKDLPAKNLVRVEITEEGEEAFKKAQAHQDILSNICLASLSEEEQRQLLDLLRKLRDSTFKELGNSAPPPGRDL